MLAAILGVCASLPKLLGWIETGATTIMAWCDAYHKAELEKQIQKGITDAKQTGNTSAIDDMFNKP